MNRLFYYEFKTVLPKEYKIKYCWGRKELSYQLKNINKWNLNNKEIFIYGYNFAPNTFSSIWITISYDTVFFISYIATESNLKYFAELKTKK